MEYIPQSYPFVMIDKLIAVADEKTTTELTITADNILVHRNYFTTAGLIENIAQTAAAGVGYTSKLTNKQPPVGYIGAIKNFKATKLPPVGATIITETQPIHQLGNVLIVAGTVFWNNEIIASAEYKIFSN